MATRPHLKASAASCTPISTMLHRSSSAAGKFAASPVAPPSAVSRSHIHAIRSHPTARTPSVSFKVRRHQRGVRCRSFLGPSPPAHFPSHPALTITRASQPSVFSTLVLCDDAIPHFFPFLIPSKPASITRLPLFVTVRFLPAVSNLSFDLRSACAVTPAWLSSSAPSQTRSLSRMLLMIADIVTDVERICTT
jgi:hypothetical protein